MELSLAKPALPRKPNLLLKDYLLDDLSSCSSSGFRSYPRRQCCTSVRFLLEVDLKMKPPKYIKKPSPPPKSAFQRASAAVINAVKSSSAFSNKLKLALLPTTLSRKLLKRSFWNNKRHDHRKEIRHWEPIINNQLNVKKKKNPPPPPPSGFPTSPGGSGDSSSSTISDSNSKSYSWYDSDFTASSDVSSRGGGNNNSTVETLNEASHDVVSLGNGYLPEFSPEDKLVSSSSKKIGVIVGGDDSMEASCSTSSTNLKSPEGKEQLSPVSVLDCPFDDDDEVSSSPFQHRLARMEGTKKRLMRKIKKFERLTQLEPVKLEKRMVLSESDRDSDRSSPHCQYSSDQSGSEEFVDESEEDEENRAADKSFKLLQLAKSTMPPSICSMNPKTDNDRLLLDFFKERMDFHNAMNVNTTNITLDHELINIAKDWMIGQPRELFLGWEVQKNREAYIRDMEMAGDWRKKYSNEAKQEVALELETEVFATLMNEICDDLISSNKMEACWSWSWSWSCC